MSTPLSTRGCQTPDNNRALEIVLTCSLQTPWPRCETAEVERHSADSVCVY